MLFEPIAGLGGAVVAHIAHMRDVLQIRGDGSILRSEVKDFKIVLDSVKTLFFEIPINKNLQGSLKNIESMG